MSTSKWYNLTTGVRVTGR